MSLGKVYYESKQVGSLAKTVKAGKLNKKYLEEWYSCQDKYTLHKPVRKKFPRNPYMVTNIVNGWKMDLADLSSLSKYNYKLQITITNTS